ncbi:MAG: Uma2 family endonuclease [Isosphaeraceae bacterium]
MASAARETRIDLGRDDCVVIPATWRTYLRLLADRGDRPRPRYIHLDGRLTIVSPGVPHEHFRCRLGGLIEEILIGLRIRFRPSGSVTLLNARRSRQGAEADASYYLTNLDAMIGKRKLVMGVDPPPDLAVEVVVSHSERDVLEAYRLFGVREVWVIKETGLEFLVLEGGDPSEYVPAARSGLLPFLSSEELATWLFREDFEDEGALRLEFRAWVQETLAPRL